MVWANPGQSFHAPVDVERKVSCRNLQYVYELHCSWNVANYYCFSWLHKDAQRLLPRGFLKLDNLLVGHFEANSGDSCLNVLCWKLHPFLPFPSWKWILCSQTEFIACTPFSCHTDFHNCSMVRLTLLYMIRNPDRSWCSRSSSRTSKGKIE